MRKQQMKPISIKKILGIFNIDSNDLENFFGLIDYLFQHDYLVSRPYSGDIKVQYKLLSTSKYEKLKCLFELPENLRILRNWIKNDTISFLISEGVYDQEFVTVSDQFLKDMEKNRHLFYKFSNWIKPQILKFLAYSKHLDWIDATAMIYGISPEECRNTGGSWPNNTYSYFFIKNDEFPYKEEAQQMSKTVRSWCSQDWILPAYVIQQAVSINFLVHPLIFEYYKDLLDRLSREGNVGHESEKKLPKDAPGKYDLESPEERACRISKRMGEIIDDCVSKNMDLPEKQEIANQIHREDSADYKRKKQPEVKTYSKELDGYKKLIGRAKQKYREKLESIS